MKYRDYYEILEIPRTATEAEIKKAFRRLARKYHPDVNPGDQSAEVKFKEVNEAYTVLSDPEQRRRYDQLGENWKNGADFTPPPGWENVHVNYEDLGNLFGRGGRVFDFSEFFNLFFGGPAQARSRADYAAKGQDLELELPLTLAQIHRGGPHPFMVEKGGRRRRVEVNIPPGVREGTVIRLKGMGESGSGGPAGDLFLKVKLIPDPRLTVVGKDDLQMELPLAPWEAVLGATIDLPTLDGRVKLTVPAGSQSGQRMRLRGQGLNRREGRGDLYVKLKVMVPTRPTPAEQELFAKLAALSGFEPRRNWGT
jgi:curved DNA-binding protein